MLQSILWIALTPAVLCHCGKTWAKGPWYGSQSACPESMALRLGSWFELSLCRQIETISLLSSIALYSLNWWRDFVVLGDIQHSTREFNISSYTPIGSPTPPHPLIFGCYLQWPTKLQSSRYSGCARMFMAMLPRISILNPTFQRILQWWYQDNCKKKTIHPIASNNMYWSNNNYPNSYTFHIHHPVDHGSSNAV